MSGHTPGPWIVNHVPTSAGSAYSIGGAGVQKGCAWIYADGIRKGVDEEIPRAKELAANARLIAAAPDLLEALQALALYADECELIVKETHYAKAQSLRSRVEAAIAAISKATGGAQ